MEQVHKNDVSFSSSTKLSGSRRKFTETRHPFHRDVRRRSEEWAGTFSAARERSTAAGDGMGPFDLPPAVVSPAGGRRERDCYRFEEKKVVVDEEELFNMPVLMNSMAEGLILTPPALKRGFNWNDVALECAVDLTLWVD